MTILGTNISTVSLIVIAVIVVLIIAVGVIIWLRKRRPKHLNRAYFQERWQQAQSLCSNKDTWPLAIINADKLLDDALRRSKYKGKTMGERLVSAQHTLSANDDVWFGHKLRNKLVHEDFTKLKKKDVVQALTGFRSALKDLGAL
jgi:hypothetical protein